VAILLIGDDVALVAFGEGVGLCNLLHLVGFPLTIIFHIVTRPTSAGSISLTLVADYTRAAPPSSTKLRISHIHQRHPYRDAKTEAATGAWLGSSPMFSRIFLLGHFLLF
jgi:hypothetical protein